MDKTTPPPPTMLPFLTRLLLGITPPSFLYWYGGRQLTLIEALGERLLKAEYLLENVEGGGYEYTDGFRTHLFRQITQLESQRSNAIKRIDVLAAYLAAREEKGLS